MIIVLAVLAVVLGGILKGAVGAGVPIITAPAITVLYDVQTAVAVLVVPNLLSNVWQAWAFRRQAMSPRFLILFTGGGMAGVLAGTLLLAWLSAEVLSLLVVLSVAGYIALRLARPGWVLSTRLAEKFAGPVGLLGGVLQGTTGVSAPASLSFLNAMRLPREAFIGTISTFFVTMSAMQIPALISVGILTVERTVMGFVVLAIVFASMPIGAWLGRRFSAAVFDRIMLVVLATIAAKIILETLF